MFPLKSSPRNPRHDTNNTGHQGVARWGCGGGVQSRRDHRRDKAWFACAQREDSDKWLSGTTSITTFTRITWPAATSLPHVSSLSQLIVGGGEGRGRRIDRSLSVRFASLHVNHTESHREFRLRGRISYISMICPSAVYHHIPIQTVLSRSRANVTGRLDEIRIQYRF